MPRRRGATVRRARSGTQAKRGGLCGSRRVTHSLSTVVQRCEGVTAVVEVKGEIDLSTAAELRAVLDGLVDDGRLGLVIDLAGITFCDAAGLGALVAVNNRLQADGGALLFARTPVAQRRLLRITRLERVFPLYDTVAEAVRAASGPVADDSDEA